ncbi:MerC domain-containing protein [Flavobacterium sp.]|uniref:MerC domain-containing protein n=1 Tax=Flavobacterium sp. TaxID=239 RepID=UPI003D6BF007
MKNSSEKTTCNCQSNACPNVDRNASSAVKKTFRSIPSILMSILVAFFPKCPLCWAVYMSMLGSFGLAKIPFMWWLLPVFTLFLAVHLWMLFRRIPEKGYGPFVFSVIGFTVLLFGKLAHLDSEWLSVTGMLFIATGSFWNSFTANKLQTL